MMNRVRCTLAASALSACALLTANTGSAEGLQATGGYAERPLVLPVGKLRIDAAPSDYGYMDFGAINNGRGFRINAGEGPDFVSLGAGAAIGIIENLEAGALAMPLLFSPDFRFGNMELYGRYALLDGKFKLAGQLALRIPTDSRFGVGLGVPVIYAISGNLRLDTGLELEILTDPGDVSLDLPLAFAFDIGDTLFLGPRTGLRLPGFEELTIPAGFFIGATIGNVVDISGSFTFENFMSTANADFFSLNRFEIVGGATFFLDVF